jgi:hypothetical protein
LPAPLTARAVGTISKQAGLSIPGISRQESGIRNDRCISAAETLENFNAHQWTFSALVIGLPDYWCRITDPRVGIDNENDQVS